MYFVVAGAGAVSHALWARDIYSELSRVLAWVLLALLLWTIRAFIKRGLAVVPIVPMIVLQYYVLYGAAQFSQTSMLVMGRPYVPREESFDRAMLLAVGACLAFLGGSTFSRKWSGLSARRLWNKFPEPTDRWQTPVCVYAMISAIFGYLTLMAPESVPSTIRNVVSVGLNPYLGLILLLLHLHRHGRLRIRIVLLCLILYFAAMTLVSSMLEPIIVALYLVFVGAWIWGSGIRLRWGIVAVCLFLLLNPAKYALRQANRVQGPAGLSETVSNWQASLEAVWTGESSIADTAEVATARLSGIVALAQGVEWIPEAAPYQHGAGFGTALTYFVPRAVWPDKPSISDLINNRYALTFGLSSEKGLETSTFGILQPLDGYWDFGVAGALAYPAVFGVFLGWAFRERKGATAAEAVVALIFSSWFFQSLASLQYLVASLTSLFLGTWFILKVLGFWSTAGRVEARAGRGPSLSRVAGDQEGLKAPGPARRDAKEAWL